jgi:hypothetical protein
MKGRNSSPSPGVFSFASPCRIRPAGHVADAAHEALSYGTVASGAGGVGVAEPVVRSVEEPLEHDRIWHTGEIPLRIPVRGRGGEARWRSRDMTRCWWRCGF